MLRFRQNIYGVTQVNMIKITNSFSIGVHTTPITTVQCGHDDTSEPHTIRDVLSVDSISHNAVAVTTEDIRLTGYGDHWVVR
jgi:hypothetical protein